ncbi:MAG: shikimate kinase, partial [Acidobacteriota bacterium]
MKSLFLVGFMASGKTTVGPVLAARLGVPFTDLDRLSEAESGTTIAAIIG